MVCLDGSIYFKGIFDVSKIVLKNKKGKIIIINKLSYPEAINERVYNNLKSGMFEGLFPVEIYQKRKKTRIECTVQGLISLTQYFKNIVTKKMFLDFVHEMILQIKNCEKNMIDANNLDLQRDKIFINPQTQKVKCIVWPIVNNQRGNPPYVFFKQLPVGWSFNPYEDNNYLRIYNEFFNGINPFSINDFDRMICKLSGEQNIQSANILSDKGEIQKKEEGKNIEYDPSIDIRHKDDRMDIFCSSCGTKNYINANYCVRCGAKIKSNEIRKPVKSREDNTIDFDSIIENNDSDKTEILKTEPMDNATEPMFENIAILTMLRTNKNFIIKPPTFQIGREEYCDLFISDNKFISKNHANIIKKGNRYYIVDCNSENKTFVDGKIIPAEKEVEILSGTKIRLANEEFIFDIQS